MNSYSYDNPRVYSELVERVKISFAAMEFHNHRRRWYRAR